MRDINKIKIIKRIDFIKMELQDMRRYENITYEEYKIDRNNQRIIERIIENIANALIDIIKITLSEFDIPIPDTYREIILSLREIKFFENINYDQLSEIARMRNILAHQYLDIRWGLIEKFIKNEIGEIEKLIKDFEIMLESN